MGMRCARLAGMRVWMMAGALVLTGLTPGVAAAADTVPVTVKVANCDGCSIMATWSKGGKSGSKFRSSTSKVSNGSVKFMVPKGYWLYFTGTSPKAQVDAATILVTQFVGSSEGAKVSAKKTRTLNSGAAYCLRAKKQTISARAALVKDGKYRLLSLWASPQLASLGNLAEDGIKGVYGTQNTLLCSGKYY